MSILYAGYNNKAVKIWESSSPTPPAPTIVSWADGTDEEIAAMLEAHYAGEIDIHDYWNIGDTRTVSLSAMDATGVGESHVAQDVEFVIVHDTGNELVTSINGITNAAFVIQQKDCLSSINSGSASNPELGYMNSSYTNLGSWNDCARRTWCNNVYYNALPSSFKNIVKQVNVITAQTYNGSTNQTSNDYIFLPAAKEMFGGTASSAGSETSYSNLTEFNALTQWEYYKTASNRTKKIGSFGSKYYWWERSPHYDNSTRFCFVDSDGSADYGNAWSTIGIAPCGCV